MSIIKKDFPGKTLSDDDLSKLFSNVTYITSVRVGKNLQAPLLMCSAFNEKASELYGQPITWVRGNSIVIKVNAPRKTFHTVNVNHEDYPIILAYRNTLQYQTGENFTIGQAIIHAVSNQLEKVNHE